MKPSTNATYDRNLQLRLGTGVLPRTIPQKTAMDIAREKNCATPNSLVQQFKREFESLWAKTASPRPGVEGEEHRALVFYEGATNNYPFVELSPGKHIRMGKSQYAPSVPAMPNVGPETREALAALVNPVVLLISLPFFTLTRITWGLPPIVGLAIPLRKTGIIREPTAIR